MSKKEVEYKKFINKISIRKRIDYGAYDEEPDKIFFVKMTITEFINAYILNVPVLLLKAIEYLNKK